MNSDEKATLSALIDGESESLEERRFLRDFDPALAMEAAQSWQLIGRVLRGGQDFDADLAGQQALFCRIQAEIAAEPDLAVVPEKKTATIGRPWIYGLAASVLIVALAAFIVPSLQAPTPALGPNEASVKAPGDQGQSVALAAFNTMDTSEVAFDEMRANPDLKALDDVGRAQLRAYLKQHDELSQLGSRQVFVNYPPSTSSN
ncbi:MAG: hypothetical protein HN453_06545 [Gammaproteobacteria bacterium]|jgi:hypothetical protein|nr:hypothetical protein [Gammaproteobacteria bacterium]